MKQISSVNAVFPSFAGAYRLKIEFADGTERHFYMMPDGSLFIPPNHADANMLLNIKRANGEWNWAISTWPKQNENVQVFKYLPRDIFEKVKILAQKFDDPSFYHREVAKKVKGESKKPILKNDAKNAEALKQVRRKINEDVIRR